MLRKKKQIKEEKELARLIEIEEKKRNKRKNMPKKTAKLKENDNKNVYSNNPSKIMQLGHNKFNALVKKIIQQNDNKPYPEINNIPE